MKKIQCLIGATVFLIAFESCTKDEPAPNESKKAPVQQQSSSDQPQTQPPPSSCPHSAAKTQQG
jgi:hypothetical protein